MPVMNWPKAPLPNRVEGEKSPQMVDRGGARLTATTWADRLRDIQAQFASDSDPASDAMGMAGPMQAPAALGLGIVKTAGPKALTKVGKWGRGPANEALEYLAKKFPRLTQQVEFLMDDTMKPTTSASWAADNFLPYRADQILYEGAERTTGKAGRIKLNPNIHKQGQGADDSVNSIAHELQHATDNLRSPNQYQQGYDLLNVEPFNYEWNPFENLANITGAMEQGRFVSGKRGNTAFLEDWAGQMRGRFPDKFRDVIDPLMPKLNEDPEVILRALRAPNRFFANAAEASVPGWTGNYMTAAKQQAKLNKHLKSPDALRKAILARKGR